MNIEARKIEFIQEFLKLQSDEAITRLEKLLRKERVESDDQVFEPMTQYELEERIDESEADFKAGRFKTSDEILAKYNK